MNCCGQMFDFVFKIDFLNQWAFHCRIHTFRNKPGFFFSTVAIERRMSSFGEDTHWCHQCHHSFWLDGEDIVCPHCYGGFVEELNDEHDETVQNDFNPGIEEDLSTQVPPIFEAMFALMGRRSPYPRFGLLEAVDTFTRERMAGRNPNFDVRRRSGSVPGQNLDFFNSFWSFHDHMSGSTFANVTPEGRSSQHTGLEELAAQLSLNEQREPVPTPASHSCIEAMPTIKINQMHLGTDSHCPVCKEKFELESEAKALPCNHIYHNDCILPWLVQHNTCPVCRLELPQQESGHSWGGSGDNNSEDLNEREITQRNLRRRHPIPDFFAPRRIVTRFSSGIHINGLSSDRDHDNEMGYPE